MQSVKNVLAVNMVVAAALAGEANTKSGLIELDLHMKSKNSANPTLALYTEEGHPDYLDMELMDFMDIQIYSTLYFGSEREPHQVIFDTGSQWLWVQTAECGSCATSHNLNYSKSDTFSFMNYEEDNKHVSYGSGSIWGKQAQDTVCIDEEGENCAFDMTFLAVMDQRGLGGMSSDGIVGLAPKSKDKGAVLFVESLYKAGAINQNLFSFSIGRDFEKSKIIIGDYDLEKYAAGQLIWHKLLDTQYWTLPMQSVSYGDARLEIKTNSLIVDTGTSMTLVPSEDFNALIKAISAENSSLNFYPVESGLYGTKCSLDEYNNLNDIYFSIDNVTYELPRSAYMKFEAGTCTMKLMQQQGGHLWVLGLNFFHGYYTIFDAGNKKVGFARSVASQGEEVIGLAAQQGLYSTDFRNEITLQRMKENAKKLGKLVMFGAVGLFSGFFVTFLFVKIEQKQGVEESEVEVRARADSNVTDQEISKLDCYELMPATPPKENTLSVDEKAEKLLLKSVGSDYDSPPNMTYQQDREQMFASLTSIGGRPSASRLSFYQAPGYRSSVDLTKNDSF